MSKAVLKSRNLSKIYKDINGNTIHALDSVSFDLLQGEVLGIAGKNGAGKTTLLKIIAETTAPSSGHIEYSGNCISIIEVGTGFHPDLTGKENARLSAKLLGIKSEEFEKIYPKIEAFSELGHHINRPIKNYSNGMYLRLAFSIAFHLPIDILLLDEIIAVGDLFFQKKCIAKIAELKNAGAGILLVSHNPNLLKEFCDRCLLIEEGKLTAIGPSNQIIEQYMNLGEEISTENEQVPEILNSLEDDKFQFLDLQVSADKELPTALTFKLTLKKKTREGSFQAAFEIKDRDGNRLILDSYALKEDYQDPVQDAGIYSIRASLAPNVLGDGNYKLGLLFNKNKEFAFHQSELMNFKIEENKSSAHNLDCLLSTKLNWEVKRTDVVED